MLKACYTPYTLHFLNPARTSRQVMTEKLTYFIKVYDEASPDEYGIGECALFKGLSCDDRKDYEQKLAQVCRNINTISADELKEWPSIVFGLETAMLDFKNGCKRTPFPSPWSRDESGITINGLVWMGSIEQMSTRIEQKLQEGFRCIKFKIGGEDFDNEYSLLQNLRNRFAPKDLEIRLDANGAFSPSNAMRRLEQLSKLQVHSLEQPIMAGQVKDMARICRESPIPIALDEELIGHNDPEDMFSLLSDIKPAYIILKPALCGGFSGAMHWISIARLIGNIGWWATSALESNIGLNAIAQWDSTLRPTMPQGLGTGNLFSNNIPSPLQCVGAELIYNNSKNWEIPNLPWK